MQQSDAKNIFKAVAVLCDASSQLITAIDEVGDREERRELRRKYAEMIAGIERSFVYEVCSRYPQYADGKPD